MEIECSCCQARYRVKESMLMGFREAEVRCRKCGGTIAVLNPGKPSRTTAAKIPGDRSRGLRPHPLKGKDHPLVERQDPTPPHARTGLAKGEGKTRTRTALAEEPDSAEPVPDNVYPLDLFRGGLPKRVPTGGYDISGSIRPDPSVSAAAREFADRTPAVAEPLEKSGSMRSSLLEEQIHWQKEGIVSAPTEASLAVPDNTTDAGKSFPYKLRRPEGGSFSMSHRPTHIAFVYLLLLFLGGFGYLLVRFFSHMINGGGG